MARYEQLNVNELSLNNTQVTATAAELNQADHVVADASFTIGAEASNAITVNIQLKDANGTDMAVRSALTMYLSNDADGDSFEAASGTLSVAAGTDGAISELATDNTFLVVSEVDGDLDIVVTETVGANTLYLILVMPNGKLKPSGALTFA